MSRERSLSWASPAGGAIRPIGSWWATGNSLTPPNLSLRGPNDKRPFPPKPGQKPLPLRTPPPTSTANAFSLDFERISHAAKPPCARSVAPRVAGPRRGKIRRRFLHGKIRRHPCARHRDTGRALAAVAERPGPRLGHGRIRHAAARHAGTHPPRGGCRQAGRPHRRDPAADRP